MNQAEAIKRSIEAAADVEKPKNMEYHQKLFSDVDDVQGQRELQDLYQWGLVNARWNEQTQQTEWQLSDFHDDLEEKGLIDLYVHACRGEVPNPKENLNAVRVLSE